jgi:hypothetical protein
MRKPCSSMPRSASILHRPQDKNHHGECNGLKSVVRRNTEEVQSGDNFFISRDDGYSPPKTVEAVRHLVEQDHVLLLFGTLGTAPNTAIRDYLNDNKVPQLFVAAGNDKWNDPRHHPWTMEGGLTLFHQKTQRY